VAGRIRSIKPEILEDEEVAGLSDGAWRLWVSLWALADDHGNARSTTKWLAGQIWWVHGRDPIEVEKLIAELVQANRIELYAVRTERYLHLRNWEKHQRIDNAGKPRVPLPEEGQPASAMFCDISPRVAANLSESPLDQRPRPTTNDPERDIPDRPPAAQEVFDFEAVYALYPRKEGRKKGLARCRSSVKSRSKYDALLRAVKNYAATVTDVSYAKHFDTFMGCWEDYVDAGLLTPRQVAKPSITAPSANFTQPGIVTDEYT
jgi:hypothetical protein